jgi:hypothetical protein
LFIDQKEINGLKAAPGSSHIFKSEQIPWYRETDAASSSDYRSDFSVFVILTFFACLSTIKHHDTFGVQVNKNKCNHFQVIWDTVPWP